MKNIISFRREIELEHGQRTTTLHIGAVTNKLDELKKRLEELFGTSLAFKKSRFSNHGEVCEGGVQEGENFEFPNKEYNFQGVVNGVPYSVSLEHIGCPVPYSMAEIHHAGITLQDGMKDEVTPILRREFLEYGLEMRRKIREYNL